MTNVKLIKMLRKLAAEIRKLGDIPTDLEPGELEYMLKDAAAAIDALDKTAKAQNQLQDERDGIKS